MIQLNETDLLWKCYKRYYSQHLQPPHPHSVCNYFWKSIGGLVLYVVCDLSFFILTPFLALICWYFAPDFSSPEQPNVVWGVSWLIFIIISALYTFLKSANFLVKHFGDRTVGIVALLIIDLLLSLTISPIKDYGIFYGLMWGAIYLNSAILAVVVIFLLILWLATIIFVAGVDNSNKSNTKKVVIAYCKSFKDKLCPLVKAPWEKEEVEK